MSATDASLVERIADLLPEDRAELLGRLTDEQLLALRWDWRAQARPKQVAPEGDWSTWIVRAGRGFGKTRTGAGWTHERAMEEPREIAYIAKTPADARDFMIEGPGGILRNTPPWECPLYEPSKRSLSWPNGSEATVFSSEDPNQLRGFSGDTAWLDEFAKWKNPEECWNQLQYGMREVSSDRPRQLITTTPRAIKVLRAIEARESTVTVTGSSYENLSNLAPEWVDDTLGQYEGTRLGRQEIHAEYLDDVPGALWNRKLIEETRWPSDREAPTRVRVVVGVDPAASTSEGSSETGIVVAAVGPCSCRGEREMHGFVVSDRSLRASPDGWGRAAVRAYETYRGDRIVGERNNGGDMVEHVVRTVEKSVSFKSVYASRGKAIRAEPIAALYEQGKVHHLEPFPDLEDQMCTWVPGEPGDSPDRVDALVWALTDLMVKAPRPRERAASSSRVSM